jgi:hypothetical protein
MTATTIRTLARHAARAYPKRDYAGLAAVKHLRRGFVRAHLILGHRSTLAMELPRKAHEKRDAVVVATAVLCAAPVILHDIAARLV